MKHPGPDTDTPWTTARCNRLIRPIASRILILKKGSGHRRPSSAITSATVEQDKTPSAHHEEDWTSSSDHKEPVEDVDAPLDPDWVPKPAVKKLKRKYAGRCNNTAIGHAASHRSFKRVRETHVAPGEITVPTPILSRTIKLRGIVATGPLDACGVKATQDPVVMQPVAPSRGRGKTNNKAHVRVSQRETSPERLALLDGILEGFDKLLRATRRRTARTCNGPRSLLSMCLRAVPEYIAAEEMWRKEEDEGDDTDIAAEVFADLENMGSGSGRGWPRLREVVKADGVRLIREAIRHELLPADFVKDLVECCLGHSAMVEAEELLSGQVAAQPPFPQPDSLASDLLEKFPSSCLRTIDLYASHSHRRRFEYSVLRFLLADGRLPVEWLATKTMGSLWCRIVETLAGGDQECLDVVEFLESAMLSACGLPSETAMAERFSYGSSSFSVKPPGTTKRHIRDALTNTFLSLTSLLSAVVIVRRAEAQSSTVNSENCRTIGRVLAHIRAAVLQSVEAKRSNQIGGPLMNESQTRRAMAILATSFLLRPGKAQQPHSEWEEDVEDCIRCVEYLGTSQEADISETVEEVSGVVCSVATCGGRTSNDCGFQYLQIIVDSLLTQDATTLSPYSISFLRRLGLQSALEFAEKSASQRHTTYASSIERRVMELGTLKATRTPSKISSAASCKPKRFRWEEGICEWVVSTPKSVVQRMRHMAAASRGVPDLQDHSPQHKGVEPSEMHPGLDDIRPHDARLPSPIVAIPTRLYPEVVIPLPSSPMQASDSPSRAPKRRRRTVSAPQPELEKLMKAAQSCEVTEIRSRPRSSDHDRSTSEHEVKASIASIKRPRGNANRKRSWDDAQTESEDDELSTTEPLEPARPQGSQRRVVSESSSRTADARPLVRKVLVSSHSSSRRRSARLLDAGSDDELTVG